MEIIRGRRRRRGACSLTETFTGTVFMDPVLPPTDGNMVDSVAFQPGARTNWHRHERGQLLLVTSGEGLVANEAGDRSAIRAGDAVGSRRASATGTAPARRRTLSTPRCRWARRAGRTR